MRGAVGAVVAGVAAVVAAVAVVVVAAIAIAASSLGCSSASRSSGTAQPAIASPGSAAVVERSDATVADAATARALRDACSIKSREACDELAARCDGGDNTACLELGDVYRLGLGNPQDLAKARELFARVCKRASGPYDGCVDLVEINCRSDDASVRSAAMVTLEDACNAKLAPACAFAGLIYTEGLCTVPYNEGAWTFGVQLYQRACDLGHLPACTQLGLLYRAGHGVKKDNERGKRLLFDACRRGDMPACEYLKTP